MDSRLQQLSHLPSLPTVAARLLGMFSDPDISISELACILQTDPALSGKMLKAANTSRVGMKRPVSDLQRAVVLLGKKTVMALALGFSLSEASMSQGPYSRYFADFWFQSLVRGCAASVLAKKFSRTDAGEAFTIGLLARIGRLALLNQEADRFVALIQKSNETSVSLNALEMQELDVTSTQISMYLSKEWKLPERCLTAVEGMNASIEEACQSASPDDLTLTDVLRIASAYADFFSGEHPGLAIAKVYELSGEVLGQSEEEVNLLVDEIRQELDEHSVLFSVDMSKVGSPMQLLSQAMNHLSLLVAATTIPLHESDVAAGEVMEENGRLKKRVLELTQSSYVDSLTSLQNRTYLIQQLQDRVAKAIDAEEPIAVLFIDVDHFKRVNDTHGHLVGDEVLRTIARILKDASDPEDVIARFGGEEFVVLLSAPDKETLCLRAEQVRHRVDSHICSSGNIKLNVTVSVGGSFGLPTAEDAMFVTRILDLADGAMYLSKRNGRNLATVVEDRLQPQRQSECVS